MIIIAGLPLLSSKQILIVSGFVKPYEPQMSSNIVFMKSSAAFRISVLYSAFVNIPIINEKKLRRSISRVFYNDLRTIA